MKGKTGTIIVTAVVTWFVASFVFHNTYTRDYLPLVLAVEAMPPTTVTSVTYAGPQEVEISVGCVGAGNDLPRGCRMLSAANTCAQLSCEAGLCADLANCEAADAYTVANCDFVPAVCGINPPGVVNPPPRDPNDPFRCRVFDYPVCYAVTAAWKVARDAVQE